MSRKPLVSFYHRRLANQELAGRPLDNWHNSEFGETGCSISFLKAWEVDEETYRQARSAGVLCRVVDGRFILANL